MPQVIEFRQEENIDILLIRLIDGKSIEELSLSLAPCIVDSVLRVRDEISMLVSLQEARLGDIPIDQPSYEKYKDKLMSRLTFFPGTIDQQTSDRLLEKISLLDFSEDLCFCHNDISESNLIFNDDGSVKAILDWEEASVSSPSFESVCLRYYPNYTVFSAIPEDPSGLCRPSYTIEKICISFLFHKPEVTKSLVTKFLRSPN
ncbi:hypothetical protein GGF37_000821 [Kickxella alabastrina]|nr:hypothetical protein GGF37_000821 [Kickxella alabastrina]